MIKGLIKRVIGLDWLGYSKKINEGIKVFNQNIQEFGDSMSKFDKEFSDDVRKTQEHQKIESNKNQNNVEKLFGPKKSIW